MSDERRILPSWLGEPVPTAAALSALVCGILAVVTAGYVIPTLVEDDEKLQGVGTAGPCRAALARTGDFQKAIRDPGCQEQARLVIPACLVQPSCAKDLTGYANGRGQKGDLNGRDSTVEIQAGDGGEVESAPPSPGKPGRPGTPGEDGEDAPAPEPSPAPAPSPSNPTPSEAPGLVCSVTGSLGLPVCVGL